MKDKAKPLLKPSKEQAEWQKIGHQEGWDAATRAILEAVQQLPTLSKPLGLTESLDMMARMLEDPTSTIAKVLGADRLKIQSLIGQIPRPEAAAE